VFSYLRSYGFRRVLLLKIKQTNKFYRLDSFCEKGAYNNIKDIAKSISHVLF